MEFLNIDVKKGADNVKELVKVANHTALKTSEKLVDGSLDAAEKWQGVAEKALKTGTVLLEKQQDLMFAVLEGLKKQGLTGTMRLKNLFSLEVSEQSKTSALRKKEAKEVAKITKEAIAEVGAKVAEVEQTAKATISKAINKTAKKVDATVSKVEKKAKKEVAAAKKEIASVEEKAVAVAKVATKKVAKATKPAVAKKEVAAVSAKITTTTTTTLATDKDDLKTINGIGAKMEEFLNKIGIVTFADLAKSDAATLKLTMVSENPRYKMFDPADWIKEAGTKK
jgi:predicted flap endonuclease-1-like 5' DNA nuclease